MNEFETFYGEIREQQTGLMVITIPKKLMEFTGWKEGDMLKVMAKKKEEWAGQETLRTWRKEKSMKRWLKN